jgi:hypothetical protein
VFEGREVEEGAELCTDCNKLSKLIFNKDPDAPEEEGNELADEVACAGGAPEKEVGGASPRFRSAPPLPNLAAIVFKAQVI